MLLERVGINPDQADTKYGRTPLSWAAAKGHEGVVKMLLEREDVNPNQGDTKNGWTPLSWAASSEHQAVVKMLSEWKGVPTATPDNKSQTSLSLALPAGHDSALRITLERGNVNCTTADCCGLASLPPSAVHPDESVVEMEFRSHGPNTDMTDSNCQPALLSAAHGERPRLLHRRESVSNSVDADLSTKSPWWSRPLSTWPLKLCCL